MKVKNSKTPSQRIIKSQIKDNKISRTDIKSNQIKTNINKK